MRQQYKFNLKDITQPKDGLVVTTNNWWMCVDGDPQQALFFGDVPQCNRHKQICKSILNSQINYGGYGDSLRVVFVEIAYVPNR